jgi:uncharacterized membrane protein YhdT
MDKPDAEDRFYDSQYRHVRQCLKEARFVAITWFAALFFISGWIGYFGYLRPSVRPDPPQLILGIPSWVVLGLLAPWIVLIVVTWIFAAWILKDDEPLEPMPGSAVEGEPQGSPDAKEIDV